VHAKASLLIAGGSYGGGIIGLLRESCNVNLVLAGSGGARSEFRIQNQKSETQNSFRLAVNRISGGPGNKRVHQGIYGMAKAHGVRRPLKAFGRSS
jgi:hypothetical protein